MAEVLGGFEHKVLLAMMRLGSRAYSVPIVRELEQQTGRPVAPQTFGPLLSNPIYAGFLTAPSLGT